MFLLIFTHINTGHHCFIIKKKLCECFSQFGFTYSGSAQEDEGTNRTLGILQSCAAAAYGIGYSCNGFILPDNTLM